MLSEHPVCRSCDKPKGTKREKPQPLEEQEAGKPWYQRFMRQRRRRISISACPVGDRVNLTKADPGAMSFTVHIPAPVSTARPNFLSVLQRQRANGSKP